MRFLQQTTDVKNQFIQKICQLTGQTVRRQAYDSILNQN
uniref:Uncharacterized protein n=1 Tax=Rhizophora mucronata TaxID=61149 RepID=A0A2P2QS84_RHIMU